MAKPRKPRIPPIWHEMMPGDINCQRVTLEKLESLIAAAAEHGLYFERYPELDNKSALYVVMATPPCTPPFNLTHHHEDKTMSELDGRHEWPLIIEDELGFPDDDRKPGVYLLETDYSVEGEETKRTAQIIASPHGAYWWICDWERHDTKDGQPYWVNRSGFNVSTGLIEQLTKLGPQP